MNKNWPIGIFLCSTLIVVASFLPWGSFQAAPQLPFSGGPFSDMNPLAGTQFTVNINGWNGSFNLMGLTIPNWTLVVLAVLIALFAWLRAAHVWRAQPAASLALAGYGALHSGAVLMALLLNGHMGIGSLLTCVSFVALIVLLIRELYVGSAAPSSDDAGI